MDGSVPTISACLLHELHWAPCGCSRGHRSGRSLFAWLWQKYLAYHYALFGCPSIPLAFKFWAFPTIVLHSIKIIHSNYVRPYCFLIATAWKFKNDQNCFNSVENFKKRKLKASVESWAMVDISSLRDFISKLLC